MRPIFSLFILLILVGSVNAEDLFSDADSGVASSEKTAAVVQSNVLAAETSALDGVAIKPSPLTRFKRGVSRIQFFPETKAGEQRRFVFNVESVMLRGDISGTYEVIKGNAWSLLFSGHVNPHETYNDITGAMGLSSGARFYVDTIQGGIFFQFSGGLNREYDTNWYPKAELGAGYFYRWKESLGIESAIYAQRSYHVDREDIMVYGSVGLNFDMGFKLFY